MIDVVIREEISMRHLELEKNFPDCPIERKEDIINEYKSELTRRLEMKLEAEPKIPLIELYRMMSRETDYWYGLVREYKEILLSGKVKEPDHILFGSVFESINWGKLGIVDDWAARERIYYAEWKEYCEWHSKHRDLNYNEYKAKFQKYMSGLEDFIRGKIKDAKDHGYEPYAEDY